MAAPKGNKYNEKWPKDTALIFMEEALTRLQEDKEIKFIGTLATAQNTYKDIYTYLVNKFKDIKDFSTIKKRIDNIIEERLFTSALNNESVASVAIFGLKNNHDWKDKQEHKHEGSLQQNILNLGNGKEPKE